MEEIVAVLCSSPGCDRPRRARGYCSGHYSRWRKGLPTDAPLVRVRENRGCSAPDCASAHFAKGYCQKHYNQIQKSGSLKPDRRKYGQHGVASTYTNHGCRCDDCKAAWNAYCAEYRRSARESWSGFIDPALSHGEESTYQNHGCRCEKCKASHNQRGYDLAAIKKSPAFQTYRQSIKSCEICGNSQKSLVVDHHHGTGAFRGMLCTSCNTAIGKLGDSVEVLSSAIQYLTRPRPLI